MLGLYVAFLEELSPQDKTHFSELSSEKERARFVLNHPFISNTGEAIADKYAIVKVWFDELQVTFDESSMKITDGRAHDTMSDEHAEAVVKYCKQLVPQSLHDTTPWIST